MFTKQKAQRIKGVAIWMMMFHHCFLAGRFEKYGISLWPLTNGQIINLANFSKICVSIFAFISGYGLFLSYNCFDQGRTSVTDKNSSKWICSRLRKTLSGYWFVVVVCMYGN